MIPLAGLVLRRALGPGTLLPLAALLALAATAGWSPPQDLPLAPDEGEALGRALARRGVFLIGLAASTGLLTWRAAALVAGWRRAEGDWLGARAPSRLAALASTTLGLWLAAALCALATAAAAELAAGAGGPALRQARALPAPGLVLLPGDGPQAWVLEDPRGRLGPGTLVRAELFALPGAGPAATATLTLAREGAAPNAITAMVAARGEVRVPVPSGAGALHLELSRGETGAGLALPTGALSLLEPARGEREAGLSLLLRALLVLAAATSLALGLAAWTSPATAMTGTLVLGLPLLRPGAPAFVPGADISAALDATGAGLVPPLPHASALLGLLLLTALALAIASLGLRDWRRA